MKLITAVSSLFICLLKLNSFDTVDKSSSEYITLQRLEREALKNKVGREYIYDLTHRRGFNKTRIKYLGIAHTSKGKQYKVLTSFFVFSTGIDMCRGTSKIKIYDMKDRFIGEYYVGMPESLPDTLVRNKLLYLSSSEECSLRKARYIDFSDGLPKSFYIPCTKDGGDIYGFSNGN